MLKTLETNLTLPLCRSNGLPQGTECLNIRNINTKGGEITAILLTMIYANINPIASNQ